MEGSPNGRMKAISLFSGIGGFDLGLERAGMEVVAQCDNDPFCNKVLAHHWPGVKRYGDVRDIGLSSIGTRCSGGSGASTDITSELRPTLQSGAGCVDLICGGFPCQDLSVAGKRAGLAGDRSGLWFEFHRILSELRPTFCIIENVPGLLSSNRGRDFGVVLSGLGELWPAVGWAILDSQYFGVPQRRRRVYVIGGPSRACVQQILSLCEGGDWNTQARREAGKDVARPLGASATSFGGQRYDLDNETYVTHSLRADGFDASEDGTGRGTPLISVRTAQAGSNGWGIDESGTAYTLDGANGQAIAGASVRRLTPVECERLQGFPDGWTDVDGAKDGPRYKALGNAVTVPVIEYIGRRIMAL